MLEQIRRHAHFGVHDVVYFGIVDSAAQIVGFDGVLHIAVHGKRHFKAVAHGTLLRRHSVVGVEQHLV